VSHSPKQYREAQLTILAEQAITALINELKRPVPNEVLADILYDAAEQSLLACTSNIYRRAKLLQLSQYRTQIEQLLANKVRHERRTQSTVAQRIGKPTLRLVKGGE